MSFFNKLMDLNLGGAYDRKYHRHLTHVKYYLFPYPNKFGNVTRQGSCVYQETSTKIDDKFLTELRIRLYEYKIEFSVSPY